MGKERSEITKSSQDNNGSEMTFWGHLEALRWTLIRIVAVVVVLVIVLFLIMPKIFDSVILGPTSSNFFLYKIFAALGKLPFLPNFADDNFSVDIININVASQFMTHISTSFYLALVLSVPYIVYEIWKFIRPALFPKEVKSMKMAFTLGAGMFYLGCALGYGVVFPFTFRFLVEYRVSETVVNQINLNSYTGIFFMMILIMGIMFELPLLAWILSKLRIINKEMLKKGRKYAFVGLLVLAAVITPTGDPFTLMVVFLPLYLLYELSIFLVQPKRSEDEEDEDYDDDGDDGDDDDGGSGGSPVDEQSGNDDNDGDSPAGPDDAPDNSDENADKTPDRTVDSADETPDEPADSESGTPDNGTSDRAPAYDGDYEPEDPNSYNR